MRHLISGDDWAMAGAAMAAAAVPAPPMLADCRNLRRFMFAMTGVPPQVFEPGWVTIFGREPANGLKMQGLIAFVSSPAEADLRRARPLDLAARNYRGPALRSQW